jgi:hypothetical protein
VYMHYMDRSVKPSLILRISWNSFVISSEETSSRQAGSVRFRAKMCENHNEYCLTTQ